MPASLKTKLDQSAPAAKSLYALTPGRQRAYLLFFVGQTGKTREARIENSRHKFLVVLMTEQRNHRNKHMTGKTNSAGNSPPERQQTTYQILSARFEKHATTQRNVVGKCNGGLEANPDKLWSLSEMRPGGEPDMIDSIKTGEYSFFPTALPKRLKSRRSLCYDGAALDARKT